MSFLKDKLTAIGFFLAGSAVALALTLSTKSIPLTTAAEPPAPVAAKPVEIDQNAVAMAENLSKAFEQVASAVSPAVVHIATSKTFRSRGFEAPSDEDDIFRWFFPGRRAPREFKRQALGSGIIISPDGYILTNAHVVSEADELKVKLSDKREFDAKVIGSDSQTEVAIIKIEGENLPTAALGDSDKASIGQWVVAIGNPFGLDRTVTQGIISARGRTGIIGNPYDRIDPKDRAYEDFIQTDAAINPGNSGGPLCNLRGEVIGINTAIYSRTGGYQGIGFAIPINMAKFVKDSMIKHGRVVRGFLGVHIQDITDELAKEFDLDSRDGSLVTMVVPDSAAEKAGIKTGDVIVVFDNHKVTSTEQLRNTVASTSVSKEVEIVVNRKGETVKLKATVGNNADAPAVGSAGEADSDFGFSVAPITPQIRQQFGIEDKDGVVITDVKQGSVADRKGLRPGDVIIEVRQQPVKDMADYNKQMKGVDPKKSVLMLIRSGGEPLYVVLKED